MLDRNGTISRPKHVQASPRREQYYPWHVPMIASKALGERKCKAGTIHNPTNDVLLGRVASILVSPTYWHLGVETPQFIQSNKSIATPEDAGAPDPGTGPRAWERRHAKSLPTRWSFGTVHGRLPSPVDWCETSARPPLGTSPTPVITDPVVTGRPGREGSLGPVRPGRPRNLIEHGQVVPSTSDSVILFPSASLRV